MGSVLSILCVSLISAVDSQPTPPTLACGQELTTPCPPNPPGPPSGMPTDPSGGPPNPIGPPLGLANADAAFLLDTPAASGDDRFEYQVSTELDGNSFPTRLYLFERTDLRRADEDNLLDVSSSGDGREVRRCDDV